MCSVFTTSIVYHNLKSLLVSFLLPSFCHQDQDQELYPVVTDSLDNTDEGDPVVGGTHDTSDGNVTHPPPSAD